VKNIHRMLKCFDSRIAGISARLIRSCLKKRILVQDQGVAEFQPAGILMYVEDLKQGHNTDIGPIDFFDIASMQFSEYYSYCGVI